MKRKKIKTMIAPNLPKSLDPAYQDGFEDGFKRAEKYFKEEVKRFYKDTKKNFLSGVATATWTSSEWRKEILLKEKADIENKLKQL